MPFFLNSKDKFFPIPQISSILVFFNNGIIFLVPIRKIFSFNVFALSEANFARVFQVLIHIETGISTSFRISFLIISAIS